MSGMYEYPSEVVLARAAVARVLAHRIKHIRAVCQTCMDTDGAFTDRRWLAETVLNILDGKIDIQIQQNIKEEDEAWLDSPP